MDCLDSGVPLCTVWRFAQRIGLGQFFVDLATVAAGSIQGARKGFGCVFSLVWHNLGIVNCQYRFDWFVDHS